jgi:hypothetical protein
MGLRQVAVLEADGEHLQEVMQGDDRPVGQVGSSLLPDRGNVLSVMCGSMGLTDQPGF